MVESSLAVNRKRAKFATFQSIIMKKLLYISLLAVLLSAAMSCSRSVDKRLVLADTLMWKAPDSSLAILNAINRDSLTDDENQAYYALLLTQAQFRCNGNCNGDSLINFALGHYSGHHNREHYTRSLLYKGAYYEFNTNQPVEAMKWYKLAENNADLTDYRNLAQINMRMGSLYYNNYASNNLDLEKFTKAQYYYDKLGDKYNVLRSLLMSGNVLRISKTKDAYECYDKAQSLAVELKDTFNLYSVFVNRAILCLKDSLYQESKECMIKALTLNPKIIENYHYFIISQAYAKLGFVDSAVFYLNKADLLSCTPYDSLMRYKTLKEISIAKGDYAGANQFETVYHRLSDSLEHNNNKYSITKYEADFDEDNSAYKSKRISYLNKIIYYLIAVFLTVLIVLFFYNRKKKRDYLRLVSDLRNENFSKYEELMSSLADFDNYFSKTMNLKLNAFEEIMSGAYNEQQDYLSTEIAHKITPIDDSDKKFWNGLFSYLNYKHDNVMESIIHEFPQLSNSDYNFIGLMCCGFSDAAIAVCKHYRNVHTVRGRKQKIRDKMGLKESLVDFMKSRIK